jgi:16S rRNA (uracil1498-N3)-methyltransferase
VRTIRIYQSGDYTTGDAVELSSTASQHVGVVLRMQVGDKITLFSGDNREFDATILSIKKKIVIVIISDIRSVNRESPRELHLAQALAKGDRMEFVMQKAVELGVASITPILTEHSVVKLDQQRLAKKHLQWQSIIISACEQSGRNQVPIIYPTCSLEDYLKNCNSITKLVLNPQRGNDWRDFLITEGDIAVLIGPEGGLSDAEILAANNSGFASCCLGPRILRTETAAIVALTVLQTVLGDL